MQPESGEIFTVAFDSSGRYVAAAPNAYIGEPSGKLLRVWDLRSGTVRSVPLVPPGETAGWGLNDIGFTESGQVVGSGPRGVRRFDLESGRSEWLWPLDQGQSAFMAVSKDGRHAMALAFGALMSSEKRTVAVFDLRSGTRRFVTSHGPRAFYVAMHPSGNMIVTGDDIGTVRVGRSDGGEPYVFSLGASRTSGPVAISADGRWVASSPGAEVRLWPMPDTSKPPFHTLPLPELLARLHELTNLRVVGDGSLVTGYRTEVGPFPGWKTPPTW
jgi:WD40 repeat protein